MSGHRPEERVSRPMACQRWQSLTFLHWPYDPADVQRLVPDGLVVDTFDGAAWVGLTPFLLADLRPPLLPAIPGWSTFPETNVRTYVRDERGVDGLWFLSLDVGRLAMAVGGRAAVWIPYHWAEMSVVEGTTVSYTSRRRTPGGHRPGHRITVRPGHALPDRRPELVDFLTGRWRAFSRIAGRLVTTPVEHQPWPLTEADVEALEEDLLAAAGLAPPPGEPLAHFSPGVDVRLGLPRW
jgi:uncharacterized protein YqjF (DUF2071 family)